jgi:crossover junction endodeoxyribonuclease RuvC
MASTSIRILGIDPGSVICGYGVIDVEGSRITLVEYGVIEAKKRHPSLPLRLADIHARLCQVIARSQPQVCAVEQVFHAKNVQSVVKLAHARGVAILAAAQSALEIAEYTPMQVKRSVTGGGRSGKEQVQFMVRKLLSIDETPELFDATDALAVAICHAFRRGTPAGSGAQSWKDYLTANPQRVVRR